MLILIAKFKTETRHRDSMLDLAKGMLKPSNEEDGCISYEFFQSPFEKNYFVFVERWESRKALELHFKTQHFEDFDSKVDSLLSKKPSVIAYEVDSQEKII